MATTTPRTRAARLVVAPVVAAGTGALVAFVLARAVGGDADPRLVIAVAAVMALLASLDPGTVIEAVVLCLLLGGISGALVFAAPLAPFWQQLVVGAASGLGVGKLVASAVDALLPTATNEASPAPRRSETRAARPRESGDPGGGEARIQEYDTVRVVRLHVPERPFDGTRTVARLPRVGDVAVVAHENDPGDPDGSVFVEMVDDDGHTVWLAEFDKDELERIDRPAAD